MAYTQDEKSTGLDTLNTLANGDLIIFGDVSDAGRAKAITFANLAAQIGGGGGSVQSVTDDGNGFVIVDNTDPVNPVLEFDQVALANDVTFVTTLANNVTFINALTNNATFQSNVNNFVSAGGGGGSGNASKKVGVGEIGDIGWFNIHLPFSFQNSTDPEGNVWTIQNVSAPNPSVLDLSSVNTRVFISSDQGGFLPDPDNPGSDPDYNFDANSQAIFQCEAWTHTGGADFEGGIGFCPIGTNFDDLQGTNTESVGFIRDVAGQWYARTANGAAFTETSITISSGAKHTFRCEYDPANATPQARFYVDGILLATVTTTVPNAVNTVIGWGAGNNFNTGRCIDYITAPSFAVEQTPVVDTSGLFITATASEDINIGQPVGISNLVDESIARAATTNWTTTPGFSVGSNLFYEVSIAQDKVAIVYNESTTNDVYAVVATIDRDDMENAFTFGTPVLITNDSRLPGNTFTINLHKLDTDKFCVAYNTAADDDEIQIVGATVAGTVITLGTPVTLVTTIAAAPISGFDMTQMDVDRGVLAYDDDNSVAQVIAYTFAGTVPTPGAAATLDADITQGGAIGIGKVATDKFAVAAGGSGGTGHIQLGTSVADVIALGTEVAYGSGAFGSNYRTIVSNPATDVIVVTYTIVNTSHMIAATVSGTVPTFGTQLSGVAQNARSVLVQSASLLYLAESANGGQLLSIAISGTTLTRTSAIDEMFVGNSGTSDNDKWIFNAGGYFAAISFTTTTARYFIQGMSNNFVGIAQASVLRGAPVSVLIRGRDANQTGLVPGFYYQTSAGVFVQVSTDALTNNPNDQRLVVAITPTSVIL